MLTAYQRNRLLLIIGTIICLAVFGVAGRIFHLPDQHDDAASLLLSASPTVSVVVVAVVFLLATGVATMVTRVVRREAGLVCAALGLAALSVRAGGTRQALFYSPAPTLFYTLAAELCLLFILILATWRAINVLSRRIADAADPIGPVEDSLRKRLLAVTLHALVMGLLVCFIARTDAKAQVIAAIAAGGFIGSLLADAVVQVRQSAWYFSGPLFVGLLGYLSSAHGSPSWTIGEPGGFFAPLARPLPLDYASVGPAFALLGLWVSRSWRRNGYEIEIADESKPQIA